MRAYLRVRNIIPKSVHMKTKPALQKVTQLTWTADFPDRVRRGLL